MESCDKEIVKNVVKLKISVPSHLQVVFLGVYSWMKFSLITPEYNQQHPPEVFLAVVQDEDDSCLFNNFTFYINTNYICQNRIDIDLNFEFFHIFHTFYT